MRMVRISTSRDAGTLHLRGTIKLKTRKTRKRRTKLKKNIFSQIHWEITRSVPASIQYSQKSRTPVCLVFTKGIDVPEPLDIEEPRRWQLELMSIIFTKT